MRILFLSDNFPPEVNAPANRTFEHCKEWVKDGIEVTVVTCVPNFPKGKVFDGYRNKLVQKETIEGITVIRVWSYITANEGFLKRILDYVSYATMAFWVSLFIRTDLIVATSPQFFTAIAGSMAAFFKRKKWVMEVRDIWPESIVAVGAMKKNLAIRFFEWVETKLYRSAHKIVVVTDAFKSNLIGKGVNPEKIFVFKNGANLDQFTPGTKDASLVQKLGLQGKFVIAYIGTHGLAHGLDFILNCLTELEEELNEVFFLFMGDGAEKRNLVNSANQKMLSNVAFIDSVPKQEVLGYLRLMDVALVNLKKSDTFLTVIPSKIFEAAAVEKPILLGLEGETKLLIEKYNAGLCFGPENRESFVAAVKSIYKDADSYLRYKQGCRKLADDFDRKKIAKQMLDVLLD